MDEERDLSTLIVRKEEIEAKTGIKLSALFAQLSKYEDCLLYTSDAADE